MEGKIDYENLKKIHKFCSSDCKEKRMVMAYEGSMIDNFPTTVSC